MIAHSGRAEKVSVGIVGGGIGGLTAALSLLRRGFDVHVYEQAPMLIEIRRRRPGQPQRITCPARTRPRRGTGEGGSETAGMASASVG